MRGVLRRDVFPAYPGVEVGGPEAAAMRLKRFDEGVTLERKG